MARCKSEAEKVGFPLQIKAISGGGGKEIRTVKVLEDLEEGFKICMEEAKSSFGNTELIIERYLERTRHVEVQILGDRYGKVIHFGERGCTIQRLNQKITEEAPCCNISDGIKNQMYVDAVKLAESVNYFGLGTVEFLVTSKEEYYFLEMNTWLQVGIL